MIGEPSPEGRWPEVEGLFERALEQEPAARESWVREQCGQDHELEREVLSLLAHADEDEELEGILERGSTLLIDPAGGPGGGWAKDDRIGPYRLERRIGQGGMGSVWLAVRDDQEYRQQVAIKLVRSAHPGADLVARFRAERQILASLEHPNIARLLDGGTTPAGQPYLVMEYVEGETLLEHCDGLQLGVAERLSLFRQICDAVDHAHRRLVVHRDLKPANLLVDREGTPKLLDFGIAKLLRPDDDPGLTRPHERLLTPDYASPEQVRGEPVTTASDVYSLGAVLYELLTGRRARRLQGLSPVAAERTLTGAAPTRPSTVVRREDDADGERLSADRGLRSAQLARRLRGDLDTIVLKALHLDPERRYASAAELSADLRRHLEGRPVQARPDALAYRARKLVGRHPFGVGAVTAILLLTVAFAIGSTIQARRVAAQRDRAVLAEQEAKTVSGFLTELFAVADPSESRGETVTARELLERGSELIEGELGDQPLIRAALTSTLAETYRGLGLRERAAELHREALDLRRHELGDEHLETAASLDRLGNTLRELSRFEEGEAMLRKALALRESQLPAEDAAIAESLNQLGLLLLEAGRADEAEPYLRRALETRKKAQGEDHPDTDVTRSNLAQVLMNLNRLDEAESVIRETLASRERRFGENHPEVANSIHVLATVLHRAGRFAEAEPLFQRAIAIRRKVQGERHPMLAASLNNYAVLLHDLGRLEEAEPLYREGLAIDLGNGGENQATVAYSFNNLGQLLQDRGRYDEARELEERSLVVRRVVFGEDNASYVHMMDNLGILELYAGDLEASERWLRRAHEWRKEHFGAEHEITARSLANLGVWARVAGDPEASQELLREAIRIFGEAFAAGHPRLLRAQAELAWTQAELGDREGCATTVEQTREQIGAREASSATDRGRVELAAGICAAAGGRREEAVRAFDAAIAELLPSLGEGNHWVREARERRRRLGV